MITPAHIHPNFNVEILRSQLGHHWHEVVDYVAKLPVTDPYVIAFSLTLRRIQKSFDLSQKISTCREPLCPTCASDIVESFPGTEQELLELYYRHLDEINMTLNAMFTQRKLRNTASAA